MQRIEWLIEGQTDIECVRISACVGVKICVFVFESV